MGRLPGFDYSRPFFYMVTLKAVKGVAEFARIADDAEPPRDSRGRMRYLVANAITYAFAKVIKGFAAKHGGLWPIETFIIMPDHLHILFHLRAGGRALGWYVMALIEELDAEYRRVMQISDGGAGMSGGKSEFCISRDWHDWIVKKEGQLAAFTRYIRENPKRAWLRRRNSRFFGQVSRISFVGREWFAYGNTETLRLPELVPIKGHRTTPPGSPEWNALLAAASRIGPGGAGVSTFMSPLEKACGNAIAKAGGKWIVLSPEGFPARWHPPREKERFCAQGRMLFLSLYEASTRKPTRKMLYDRCHEMIDLVIATLS